MRGRGGGRGGGGGGGKGGGGGRGGGGGGGREVDTCISHVYHMTNLVSIVCSV